MVKMISRLLYLLAVGLTGISLWIAAVHFDAIQQASGWRRWAYAMPALVGLAAVFLAYTAHEYDQSRNLHKAVWSVIIGLSGVIFVILFLLLFR